MCLSCKVRQPVEPTFEGPPSFLELRNRRPSLVKNVEKFWMEGVCSLQPAQVRWCGDRFGKGISVLLVVVEICISSLGMFFDVTKILKKTSSNYFVDFIALD